MKICGMVGGISWTSSSEYYSQMNTNIAKALGGLNSSKIILYSLNLEDYSNLAYKNEYDKFKYIVCNAAINVFKAGADFLVICSNTAHMAVELIEEEYSKLYLNNLCPILHIADCTALYIKQNFPNFKKIGLIGTIFTMKSPHLAKRLEKHGYSISIPRDLEDQLLIMDIIEKELALNYLDNPLSKEKIISIINKMKEEDGIEGIILGCTELPLLIREKQLNNYLPVFDTTSIHINAACKIQLNELKIEDFIPFDK
jgi:aspartate racemase